MKTVMNLKKICTNKVTEIIMLKIESHVNKTLFFVCVSSLLFTCESKNIFIRIMNFNNNCSDENIPMFFAPRNHSALYVFRNAASFTITVTVLCVFIHFLVYIETHTGERS